jgi:photosystem II stability/assembly factor-like uncharacterized protein
MMRRLKIAVVAALVAALACAGVAAAVMSDQVSAAGSVSTGTLQPATGVASTHPNATGASAGQVNLTWTASPSTFVAGHRVLGASSPGGPWSTVATLGAAASSYNDTTAPYNAERYYVVQAFRNTWTADSAVRSTHSLPMSAGVDRVTGSGAGTALTGPWTTAGTQLNAASVADGTRYTPTAWPVGPTYIAGIHYLDATHAWASGTGSVYFYNGTSWTTQTTPTTNSLEQVFFASTTTGWSVGAAGTIVATTNGGTTWTAQTSGTTQGLWDVECVGTTTCWAVGNAGTIVKTTNGGTTWTAQTSGTTQPLWDVECQSATNCSLVGAGGVILKTTNGGTTWTAQTSGVATRLLGVSCTSATQCWAVGASGVILTTSNGGTTWTAQTSGQAGNLWRVQMMSATLGYVSGDSGVMLKTTNGGTTWTTLTVPAANYYGLSCLSTTACIAVSDAPSILLTSDGGATWGEGPVGYVEFTPVTPTFPTGGTVSSVVVRLVFRTTTVPAAGSRFTLLASADAGATWTPFAVTAPAAANTDVTQSIDISALGFSPATRAQNILLRFSVSPKTNPITTQIDLVHVDVN